MERIKNIIFDFDGTLVDTAPLIIATMHATAQEMRLPQKTDDECRATIGLRLEDVPDIFWPGNETAKRDFASTYRRIFETLRRPLGVDCFPGVLKTLEKLHRDGYRMAIASSRSHKSLAEYVELFGLDDCFGMVVGGDDVARGKPAPDPVLSIIERLGWNAGETLTVGDAPVDIQMGKVAGTLTCAVTYGNGSFNELTAVNPSFIIDSFDELNAILKK